MAHNVNRLYKNREIFYYRIRIPKDLLGYFGGKEDLKRSLRTKSLSQAKRLLRAWDCRTEQLFTTMRLGMLSRDEIKKLADDYLRTTLSVDEKCRSLRLLPLTADQREGELQHLQRCLARTRDALTLGRPYFDQEMHSLFLQEKYPDLSPNDPEYLALERELLIRDLEIYRVELERTNGNYVNGYDIREQEVAPMSPLLPPVVTPPPEKESPLLSTVIDKYIADYKRSSRAKANSIAEYECICNLFKSFITDKEGISNIEVKSITRDNIRDFHNTLKNLPKHIHKKPDYRGKSISEILAMKSTDTLHETTILKYMSRISGLLQWAVNEGIRADNPVKGLVPHKNKTRKASEERKPFDKEDLTLLVEGLAKAGEKGELRGRPERYWIPLIALYSGMRVSEISQLYINDVKQDEETEIWYFDVETTGDDDKSVKSVAGRRNVPVHHALIKLGFLDYFQKMKASGVPRVWMNLTKSSRGYRKNFSNWFLGAKRGEKVMYPGFLREYVTKDPLKVFHSFRHTVRNNLKQKRADMGPVNEFLGWSHGDIGMDRYSEPYALNILNDEMLKLDYDINLDQLKSIGKMTEENGMQGKRKRQKHSAE